MLTLEVPADRNEADVGSGFRTVVFDLHVAVDLAQPCLARSRIVMTLEITADLNPGALETVISRAGALMNLQISVDRHIAFEQQGFAMIGLDITADRRRLVIRRDEEARALRNLYVPGDVYEVESARRIFRDGDVALDGPCQRAGTACVATTCRRGSKERYGGESQSERKGLERLGPPLRCAARSHGDSVRK